MEFVMDLLSETFYRCTTNGCWMSYTTKWTRSTHAPTSKVRRKSSTNIADFSNYRRSKMTGLIPDLVAIFLLVVGFYTPVAIIYLLCRLFLKEKPNVTSYYHRWSATACWDSYSHRSEKSESLPETEWSAVPATSEVPQHALPSSKSGWYKSSH